MMTRSAANVTTTAVTVPTKQPSAPEEFADTIYFGGPIVTMICDVDRVDALAVADGVILSTGSKDDVMTRKGAHTKLVDLNGNCLMPGFIDPHSHVTLQSAKFTTVNLDPYPIGDIKNIADIQRKLKAYIEEQKLVPGKWIFGWGYDDTGLEEMRHPNRYDLDAVTTEHPILLVHISSHLATANSKALEMVGITAETPDPEGGLFQRLEGSQEPNGVMEEIAWMGFVAQVPAPSREQSLEMLKIGLDYYAAAGITTASDGASAPGIMQLLRKLEQEGRLQIDVVAYPVYKGASKALIEDVAQNRWTWGRFRPGGFKLIVDGSIQGYTAYLSEPYYKESERHAHETDACDHDTVDRLFLNTGSPAEQDTVSSATSGESGNRGYASMSLEDVTHWVRICDEMDIPIHVHCNGDAAIDLFIKAVDTVRKDRPRPDLRNVIIHSQVMRKDQLNAAVSHGLTPSFFPIHVVFWGDRHRDLFLGPERAAFIDPARSALDRGLKITLHHDAPIAGIDMLPVVAAAVNRVTSSGELLGPEERITPYEALRSITKDAAWQYFEEHRKGTLEPGKLADMVVLDADPLKINPLEIGNIKVLETIKEGQTVFRAK
jgi:predicted amidohydrolase YtcJ